MKAAIISPWRYVDMIDKRKFHMIIQPWLSNPTYADYVRKVRNIRGSYLILDNGEFEGKRCSEKALLHSAREYEVDEIVVPDRAGDGPETAGMIRDFYEVQSAADRLNFKYMGVLQGFDLQDLGYCYEAIMDFCDVIGLPRRLKYRQSLVEYILAGEIHFLGLEDVWPLAHKTIQKRVRSIDTSAPFRDQQKDTSHLNFDVKLSVEQLKSVKLDIELLDAIASGKMKQ